MGASDGAAERCAFGVAERGLDVCWLHIGGSNRGEVVSQNAPLWPCSKSPQRAGTAQFELGTPSCRLGVHAGTHVFFQCIPSDVAFGPGVLLPQAIQEVVQLGLRHG